MESSIRGNLEQVLDRRLANESLLKDVELFEAYKKLGMCDSVRSATFGYIIGVIQAFMIHAYQDLDYDIPSEAMDEFTQMIKARASQIRSKILEVTNQ
jgi:hypothetical protein